MCRIRYIPDVTIAGATGATGAAGSDGVSGWQLVTASASSTTSVATCPAGKKVLGGGGSISSTAAQIGATFPSSPTTWTVTNKVGLGTVTAYAICATVI
jgi:hypothetical protein